MVLTCIAADGRDVEIDFESSVVSMFAAVVSTIRSSASTSSRLCSMSFRTSPSVKSRHVTTATANQRRRRT